MIARRCGVPLLAASAMALGSTSASANGRYPNADMLIVDPGDPTHLVLRATFGTLVSSDRGARWSWICEQAIGYVGDPAITVLANGAILHAFLSNVTVSTPEACSFTPLPFLAEGRNAVDVTLDPVDPSHAWVLASGLNGALQASLLEVSPSTATPLAGAGAFVPSTIEVSRSRPERIYVVGFNASFLATLLVSDDRGQTWSSRPIMPAAYAALPMYLSAVDPNDPDTVYIRVDDGTSDHVLVSHDAGQSFTDVFTLEGEMLGFALSPDGSRLAVGGPGAGLWLANTADFAFAPAAAIESLRCLTWTSDRIYACAQESLDGWTVGVSTDSAQTFEPLWHVQDLAPLVCEASTAVGSTCERSWLEVSAQIGADLVPDGIPNSSVKPTAVQKDEASCEIPQTPKRSAASALALGAIMGFLAARLRWRRQPRAKAVSSPTKP